MRKHSLITGVLVTPALTGYSLTAQGPSKGPAEAQIRLEGMPEIITMTDFEPDTADMEQDQGGEGGVHQYHPVLFGQLLGVMAVAGVRKNPIVMTQPVQQHGQEKGYRDPDGQKPADGFSRQAGS